MKTALSQSFLDGFARNTAREALWRLEVASDLETLSREGNLRK